MRTITLILGVLLASVVSLSAQNLLRGSRQAIEGQVFKLDAADARKLATQEVRQISDEWLTNLFRKFSSQVAMPGDLPPGQYISTRILNNYLYWNYVQIPNVTVYVENDHQHLYLKVYDAEGVSVPDAMVKVGETVLPYNEKTETYGLESVQPEQAFVEIEVDGVTQFFQVQRPDYGQPNPQKGARKFVNRWVVRPFNGWVIKPIVFTMRLPYDLVRIFVRHRMDGWPGLIYYRLRQLSHLGRKLAGGNNPVTFVVCSQPRYRPGDTVKVKAYLTDAQGSPLRKGLVVYANDRNYREIQVCKLQRIRAGCYVGQFVLTDSLNLGLDRQIPLNIRPKHGIQKSTNLAGTQFLYEDYELKQYTFNLRSEVDKNWLGKEVALFLEAKDMNELTVPDARAKVVVKSTSVGTWRADRFFIPDTIWAWEGNLDPAGETRLEIPAKLFDNALFQYNVEAQCWTSDNERKTQNLNLSYIHDEGKFKINQHGAILDVEFLKFGVSEKRVVTMTVSAGLGQNPRVSMLEIPAKITLNPTWNYIRFDLNDKTETWYSNGYPSISVQGRHTGDSLFIRIPAADSVKFSWHLFKLDEEIASGNGTSLRYAAKVRPNDVFYLTLHGTVAGRPFSQDYTYHCPKNNLQVEWQGPKTVYPGMTADMQVNVKDRRGKPVRRADVTAYAVNSRFEGAGRPSLSVRSYPVPPRQHRGDYTLAPTSNNQGTYPLEYERWKWRARLDTLAWYQFLYPDSNGYLYQVPIESDKAEIAPFIVKNGAIQPVEIVYLDGNPVYFAWSNPRVPYSFPVTPGRKYMVEVRLPDQVVRIDTFKVPAGQKTILSLDVDKLPKRIRKFQVSVQPDGREQSIINQQTFHYRNGNPFGSTYITFGPRFFPLTSGYNMMCGPINPVLPLDYEFIDSIHHVMVYEQGFEYDFATKLVRMRTYLNNVTSLSHGVVPGLEERPWVKDSLVARWRRSIVPRPQENPNQPYRNFSQYYGANPSIAIVRVEKQDPHALQAFILYDSLTKTTHVIRAYLESSINVPVGKWRMYFYSMGDRYEDMGMIEILPKGRNFMKFRSTKTVGRESVPEQVRQAVNYVQPSDLSSSSPRTRNVIDWDSKGPWRGTGRRVIGVVFDAATNEPLVGALVYVKGYGVGMYTDEDGKYDLDVPIKADTLAVRYLGYQEQFIRINGQGRIDFLVAEEAVDLNSVVVTASKHAMNYESVSASYSMSVDQMSAVALRNVSTADVAGSYTWSGTATMVQGVTVSTDVVGLADTTSLVPAFPEELLADLAGKTMMRKDFRDNAIWEPALRSNGKGTAAFRVKFPDDITRWDAYAVAIDRRGRAGATQSFVKAWKPLAGRLALPRFLMEGDTCLAIGKVMNYGGDTVQVRRRFTVEDQTQERTGLCGPVLLDTLRLSPPAGADSVLVSYLVDKADGYGDGEQLGIKVFPVGVRDASGHYASVWNDTTIAMQNLASDRGPINVYASTHMQKLLLGETEQLRDYSHLCNEQLSSKLIGLLAEQQIYASMGRKWRGEKDVERIIKMLLKRIEVAEGVAWGWWPGMKPELWVSLHVTKALLMAKKMGYAVNINMQPWVQQLILHLDYKWYNFTNVEALQLVHEISPELDIRSKVQALDTLKWISSYHKLAIMELRQDVGLPIDLDLLNSLVQVPSPGSYRWYDPQVGWRNYYWYQDLSLVLQSYRIQRKAGKTSKELLPLIAFLMGSRTANGWGNTYLTAQVLHTIVPDIGLFNATEKPVMTLQYGGRDHELPYDSTLTLPADVGPLSIKKQGWGMVYLNAYQRWFNPNPKRVDSLFVVDTKFLTPRGLPAGDTLQAGQPVILRTTVEVRRPMDYLMVEIPIPAGCSYGNKQASGYGYWGGYGYYREYFREKVACYIRQANAGTIILDVELQPRYGGRYVLNCARAEQMYLPLLAGQNDVRRVSIR